jgi:hypothetical protein
MSESLSSKINKHNIGKSIISSSDTKSLFSEKATFYDKWSIFRFVMSNPEESDNLNVELRKYRLKEDGSKEYCDERASYVLSKKDPSVANAIENLIGLAVQKGVELNHFRQ